MQSYIKSYTDIVPEIINFVVYTKVIVKTNNNMGQARKLDEYNILRGPTNMQELYRTYL